MVQMCLRLDLAVTKDNVLVVSHSPYLTQRSSDDPRMAAVLANERTCVGPVLPAGTLIRSLTLAQLKQYELWSEGAVRLPKQLAVPARNTTFDEYSTWPAR